MDVGGVPESWRRRAALVWLRGYATARPTPLVRLAR
jgi:hypothetical protein